MDPRNIQAPFPWELGILLSVFIIGVLGIIVWYHLDQLKLLRQKKLFNANADSALWIDPADQGMEHQYLVTIITSKNFAYPPTSINTIHLVGQRKLGMFHHVFPMEGHDLFKPDTLLKVVVTEKEILDPVVGIVLKTNNRGPNPIWNCHRIIIRNLTTNSAWLFETQDSEISFSRFFHHVPHEKILDFSSALNRRYLDEKANGNVHGGIYHAHPLSVVTVEQRYFIWIVTNVSTLASVVGSLGILFENQLRQHGEGKIPILGNVGEKIIAAAITAGISGSIVAYLINKLFRAKEKYEIGLSEVDHCIATSLKAKVVEAIQQIARPGNPMLVDATNYSSETETSEDSIPRLAGQRKNLLRSGWRRCFRILRQCNKKNLKHRSNSDSDLKAPRKPRGDTLGPRASDFWTGPPMSKLQEDTWQYRQSKFARASKRMAEKKDPRTSQTEIPSPVLPVYPQITNESKQKFVKKLLPGEINPVRMQRPCPVTSWVVASFILVQGVLASLFLLYEVLRNEMNIEIGFLIILTAFMIAVLLQIVLFEMLKFLLVSFFLARNDVKLYRTIISNKVLVKDVQFQYRQNIIGALFNRPKDNIRQYAGLV